MDDNRYYDSFDCKSDLQKILKYLIYLIIHDFFYLNIIF